MQMDWFPLWLGLRVAVLATLAALGVGLCLACLLANREFRGKGLLEAALTLPLVLPPAVLTYYVLAQAGRFTHLVFTWRGAIVAAAIYATPLLFTSSRAAIERLDPSYERSARGLGAPRWRIFWRVTLPLARHSILAATALAFARALADIGITLVIASNLSGALVLVISGLVLGMFFLAHRLEPRRASR
jgi:molybdate transport system permease protein